MGLLSLKSGSTVYFNEDKYEVIKAVDLKHVIVKNVLTGEQKLLKIGHLKSAPDCNNSNAAAVTDYSEHVKQEHWEEAKKRFEIIKPLLKEGRTAEEVKKRAKEFGLHWVSIYRWINHYESTGRMISMVPRYELKGGKGRHRIDQSTEAVITNIIDELYLSKQKLKTKHIHNEVKKRCLNAKLPVPHINTIRNRINSLPIKEVTRKREGLKKSNSLYQPIEGSFPEGKFPLDVVQIDHTLLDIILVDDIYRQPIGRPYITLAIDVYSRMAFGFYISLDHPSFFTIGQCLINGLLPKDKFLEKVGVAGEWNIWGRPRTIHADNAREFRGNDLQKFCDDYGITLAWRPVARPQFGAHIERLLGTFNSEIHTLPGTTFSNVKDKGDYDSDSEAVMTIGEFEKWLTNYIVNVYHGSLHSSIGMTPRQKFEIGIFGDDTTPGIGLPEIIEDKRKLMIELLPTVKRNIRRDGVVIHAIKYYHDVLRKWIDSRKDRIEFIFKYDPRDISRIYFYDPELKEYFPIPYRTIHFPPISVWELNAAMKYLKERDIKEFDEFEIFKAHELLKNIEEEAKNKTKKVKRMLSRKNFHKKKIEDLSQVMHTKTERQFRKEDKAGESEGSDIDELFSGITPKKNIEVITHSKKKRTE